MSRPFDPYDTWLGIPPREQPPDHYRLLGVARFERNLQVIQAAAEQRMAMIRSYQTGPRAAYTQSLLNELAQAKVRLLDPVTKQQYDLALADESSIASGMYSQDLLPQALLDAAREVAPPPPPVATVPTVDRIARDFTTAPPVAPPLAIRVDTKHRPRSFDPLVLGFWIPLGILLMALTMGLGIWWARAGDESTSIGGKDSRASQPRGAGEVATGRPDDSSSSLVAVTQEASGTLNLAATKAELQGNVQLRSESDASYLAGWSADTDAAVWTVKLHDLPSQGMFLAQVTYETDATAQGARYEIASAGAPSRPRDVRAGAGLVTEQFYVAVTRTGVNQLVFRLLGLPAGGQFTLRAIRLEFPR